MNTTTCNLSLPKTLLIKLDQAARREDANRSEVIRQAIRAYLEERNEWQGLFAYGTEQARRLGITERDVDRIVAHERRTMRKRTKRTHA